MPGKLRVDSTENLLSFEKYPVPLEGWWNSQIHSEFKGKTKSSPDKLLKIPSLTISDSIGSQDRTIHRTDNKNRRKLQFWQLRSSCLEKRPGAREFTPWKGNYVDNNFICSKRNPMRFFWFDKNPNREGWFFSLGNWSISVVTVSNSWKTEPTLDSGVQW